MKIENCLQSVIDQLEIIQQNVAIDMVAHIVQGDTSGCSKPLVDIDVKVAF